MQQAFGGCLAKGLLVTSIYLVVAWVLMLSYQFFTTTVLTTGASSFGASVPSLALWLGGNISVAAFVCSFAWLFVLSSVIADLIFGQQRRIFIQFLIGLALTVMTTAILDGLSAVGLDLSNPNILLSSPIAQVVQNAYFAFFYLSLPFVFMVVVELRAMRKHKE
jgi:hypothetical protein